MRTLSMHNTVHDTSMVKRPLHLGKSDWIKLLLSESGQYGKVCEAFLRRYHKAIVCDAKCAPVVHVICHDCAVSEFDSCANHMFRY